jgi:hypothetical protein
MKNALLLSAIVLIFLGCNKINNNPNHNSSYKKTRTNQFSGPYLGTGVDSDGDGMSDSYEKEFFNPEIDNYTYNPLIADLPVLKIDLIGPPDLQVKYIKATESSSSYGSSSTFSKTTENAQTLHESFSETAEVHADASVSLTDISVGGGGSYSATYTADYTQEWRSSVTRDFTSTRNSSHSSSMSASEASISCGVTFQNESILPLSIENLHLSAFYGRGSKKFIIGNLEYENENGFPSFILQKDSKSPLMPFFNKTIYPTVAENILYSGLPIHISPSYSDIQIIYSENIKIPYDYVFKTVNEKTASLNFSPNFRNPNDKKTFNFAIEYNDSLSLKNILDSILKIPVITENGEIIRIKNERGLIYVDNQIWEIIVKGHRNNDNFEILYHPQKGYDISEINIMQGDQVYITLREDFDYDGMADYMEKHIGCDVTSYDTDEDNIPDGMEYYGYMKNNLLVYSSPLFKNSDEDNLNDSQDNFPTVDNDWILGKGFFSKLIINDNALNLADIKIYSGINSAGYYAFHIKIKAKKEWLEESNMLRFERTNRDIKSEVLVLINNKEVMKGELKMDAKFVFEESDKLSAEFIFRNAPNTNADATRYIYEIVFE